MSDWNEFQAFKRKQGSFGNWLREKRTEQGISQDWLARQVGLEDTQISNYEHNRFIPSMDTLLDMVDVLKLDRDEALLRAGYAPDSLPLNELLEAIANPRPPTEPLTRSLRLYDLAPADQQRLAALIPALVASVRA